MCFDVKTIKAFISKAVFLSKSAEKVVIAVFEKQDYCLSKETESGLVIIIGILQFTKIRVLLNNPLIRFNGL